MWYYFAHKTTPHADCRDANYVWLLFDESALLAGGAVSSQRLLTRTSSLARKLYPCDFSCLMPDFLLWIGHLPKTTAPKKEERMPFGCGMIKISLLEFLKARVDKWIPGCSLESGLGKLQQKKATFWILIQSLSTTSGFLHFHYCFPRRPVRASFPLVPCLCAWSREEPRKAVLPGRRHHSPVPDHAIKATYTAAGWKTDSVIHSPPDLHPLVIFRQAPSVSSAHDPQLLHLPNPLPRISPDQSPARPACPSLLSAHESSRPLLGSSSALHLRGLNRTYSLVWR